MVIASNIRFTLIEKRLERFSCSHSELFENFTNYINTTELKFQPQFNDFYIRPNAPSDLDLLISLWVLGKLNSRC